MNVLSMHGSLLPVAPVTLTRAQQEALIAPAKDGDMAAREKLLASHMALILSILQKAVSHITDPSKELFEDALSAGTIGFFEALERYDPSSGVKLSTFASYYIKGEVREVLAKNGMAGTMSVHTYRMLAAYRKAADGCTVDREGRPSLTEIAGKLGIRRSTAETLARLDALAGPPEPLTDESDGIQDPCGEEPLKRVEQEELSMVLRLCLDSLPRLQREVLCIRFGFTGVPKSVEECAGILSIPRTEVLACEAMGIVALQKMESIQELHGYLE